MAEQDKPPSFGDFDERLRRLRDQRAEPRPRKTADEGGRLNYGEGLQVGIELLAGVGGGVLLGYGLDSWLETRPLFLIVFFILGAAAGTLNAYRRLRRWSAGDPGSSERGTR